MGLNVLRKTLKEINNSMTDMKTTAHQSNNPFKILKMINGEDVICKISEEYSDALVVEYPMAIVKNQVMENENNIVEHTGLQRWMNYTHDTTFVIPKERIICLGDMAPDVTLYYKHVCKRLEFENKQEPADEDQALAKMRDNIDRLAHIIGEDEQSESNTPFAPIDKSKLH